MKSQAWPRFPDPAWEKEPNCFFLTASELDDAVAAGCLACELLRQGLEQFWPNQNLTEKTQARKLWVGQRETDSGWLVSLDVLRPQASGPRAVLEFVDAPGNAYLFYIDDVILILSMKMRARLAKFRRWTLLRLCIG